MENNITVNGKTYSLSAQKSDGASIRIDASTGINTPTTLSIRQTPFVDGNKLPAHRTSVRIARLVPVVGATRMQELSVQYTVIVPKDAAIVYSTDVLPYIVRMDDVLSIVGFKSDVVEKRLG